MTHDELNNQTGINFSVEQYATLDASYLELNFDDNKQFCTLVKKVADIVNESFAKQLIEKSVELMDEHLAQMAIDLIGRDKFLEYKIKNNLHLFRNERDYLLDLVGEEKLIEILNKTPF